MIIFQSYHFWTIEFHLLRNIKWLFIYFERNLKFITFNLIWIYLSLLILSFSFFFICLKYYYSLMNSLLISVSNIFSSIKLNWCRIISILMWEIYRNTKFLRWIVNMFRYYRNNHFQWVNFNHHKII